MQHYGSQSINICSKLLLKRNWLIGCLRKASSSKSVPIKEQNEGGHIDTASQRIRAIDIANKNNIPVEKVSLSRGLALNRFEKDFLIYPEYSDSDAVNSIKLYTSALRNDLQKSLVEANVSKENYSDALEALFKKNTIPALFVPSDFGGVGMCYKDLLLVSEVLGIDWTAFEVANQYHLACTLITLFGSDEQKTRLLGGIASGSLKPAICLFENEQGFDFESMKTESVVMSDGSEKLNGLKTRVIGAANANLFFVFAKRKNAAQGAETFTCYVIERDSLPHDTLIVNSPLQQFGLEGLHINSVQLQDISLKVENILGSATDGREIAMEVAATNKVTYGAAVTGFMKSLINKLVHFCNAKVQHNLRLSENRGVQKLLTDLALNTYSVESMSYYIGGLHDEDLVLTTDIENAVIHRFANRTLREAVSSTVEILGTKSCDRCDEFERIFRDVITVISLGNMEMNLVDQISMRTLTSWANANAARLTDRRTGQSGIFSRLFGNRAELAELRNPKLVHFIAEHAHPSLENACRDLENSMGRINTVVNKIITEQGKTINSDFSTLCSVAKVIENNLVMMATISRSSRSYSIGLRNADLELAWTLSLCSRLAQITETELASLSDYFGIVRMNPTLLTIGSAVLDMGGYCIESPIEKNW